MKNDSLGDRMKRYEEVPKNILVRRTPVIIRVDGKAFHTLTRGCDKPFDRRLMNSMWDTAIGLCSSIQGSKLAYVQSDEISLLLTDYATLTTDAWFDYNVQKMASISAAYATYFFCRSYLDENDNRIAVFDSRAFNLPANEVANYFIWRQQDASRNSIQMYGRAYFSHKQLENKNCDQIQEMLFQEKEINWNDAPVPNKRGACIIKEAYEKEGVPRSRWIVDENIPIFTQDRNYIEKLL